MTSEAMQGGVAQILGQTPSAADWAALEAAVQAAEPPSAGEPPLSLEARLTRLEGRLRTVRWLVALTLALRALHGSCRWARYLAWRRQTPLK